jgi:hypothetical protein
MVFPIKDQSSEISILNARGAPENGASVTIKGNTNIRNFFIKGLPNRQVNFPLARPMFVFCFPG